MQAQGSGPDPRPTCFQALGAWCRPPLWLWAGLEDVPSAPQQQGLSLLGRAPAPGFGAPGSLPCLPSPAEPGWQLPTAGARRQAGQALTPLLALRLWERLHRDSGEGKPGGTEVCDLLHQVSPGRPRGQRSEHWLCGAAAGSSQKLVSSLPPGPGHSGSLCPQRPRRGRPEPLGQPHKGGGGAVQGLLADTSLLQGRLRDCGCQPEVRPHGRDGGGGPLRRESHLQGGG